MTRADVCRSYLELRYRPVFEAIDQHQRPTSLVQVAHWRKARKAIEKTHNRSKTANGQISLTGMDWQRIKMEDDSDRLSADLRTFNSPVMASIVHRNKKNSDYEIYPDDVIAFQIASHQANFKPERASMDDLQDQTIEPLKHLATENGNILGSKDKFVNGNSTVDPSMNESPFLQRESLPPSPGARSPRSADSISLARRSLRQSITHRLGVISPQSDRAGGHSSDADESWRRQNIRSSESIHEAFSPSQSDVEPPSAGRRTRREPESDVESSRRSNALVSEYDEQLGPDGTPFRPQDNRQKRFDTLSLNSRKAKWISKASFVPSIMAEGDEFNPWNNSTGEVESGQKVVLEILDYDDEEHEDRQQ